MCIAHDPVLLAGPEVRRGEADIGKEFHGQSVIVRALQRTQWAWWPRAGDRRSSSGFGAWRTILWAPWNRAVVFADAQ